MAALQPSALGSEEACWASLPLELGQRERFDVYELKVSPCCKRYSHDWAACPFAHPGERAARRDPRRYAYSGIVCVTMKQEGSCPRGDACNYAHSPWEYWLHPNRYHTALCSKGVGCSRKICFFAHHPSELRMRPTSTNDPTAAATAGGKPHAPPAAAYDPFAPEPSCGTTGFVGGQDSVHSALLGPATPRAACAAQEVGGSGDPALLSSTPPLGGRGGEGWRLWSGPASTGSMSSGRSSMNSSRMSSRGSSVNMDGPAGRSSGGPGAAATAEVQAAELLLAAPGSGLSLSPPPPPVTSAAAAAGRPAAPQQASSWPLPPPQPFSSLPAQQPEASLPLHLASNLEATAVMPAAPAPVGAYGAPSAPGIGSTNQDTQSGGSASLLIQAVAGELALGRLAPYQGAMAINDLLAALPPPAPSPFLNQQPLVAPPQLQQQLPQPPLLQQQALLAQAVQAACALDSQLQAAAPQTQAKCGPSVLEASLLGLPEPSQLLCPYTAPADAPGSLFW